MTILSSWSLIFEVKSTGTELVFIHVYTSLTDFRRLRTSSEDFGRLWKSSEVIVLSSKIPALPGYKSHAYISEKVGRYTIAMFHSTFWAFRVSWNYAILCDIAPLNFTKPRLHINKKRISLRRSWSILDLLSVLNGMGYFPRMKCTRQMGSISAL